MAYKISKEFHEIFRSYEILDTNGQIKNLPDLNIGDFSEVLDEVKELELEGEFSDLLFARSEIEKDLVPALKYLEMAVQSIDFYPEWTDTADYLLEAFKRIRVRIYNANGLGLGEKLIIFEEFTKEEENWFSPVCAVTMALIWELPTQAMDECILRYSRIRSETLYQDDPWSGDPDLNDYCHWMPLLALAALNSSGSVEVCEVINKTCSTASAMPFWMLVCIFVMYITDPGSFTDPESENRNWFPEWYWQEAIFDKENKNIKISDNGFKSLVDLYIQNDTTWVWTTIRYHISEEDINNFLVKTTSG